MKKKLLQKIAQLIDKYPKRKDIRKDYLDLKLDDKDKFYLTLSDKYKNYG